MQELGVLALNFVKPHTLLNGQIPHRNKPSLRLKLFNRFTFEFFTLGSSRKNFYFYWQQNEQIGFNFNFKETIKYTSNYNFFK